MGSGHGEEQLEGMGKAFLCQIYLGYLTRQFRFLGI